MRSCLGLGILLLALAPLGCDDDTSAMRPDLSVASTADMASRVDMTTTSTADAGLTAAVIIRDNFFAPASVTVAVGGTVTWTWAGANPHTTPSDTGEWDSSPSKTPGTFPHPFPTAGTFPYHCLVHGTTMGGTVIVR